MDPYKVLGVSKDASKDEIKKAYRTLVREWHPDLHKEKDKAEAESKTKEINEAYNLLKDGNYNPFQHQNTDFQGFSPFDINDIFSQFSGTPFGGFNRQNTRRIRSVNLFLSLEEIYSGVNKEFELKEARKCHSCNGSGVLLSDDNCDPCNGSGQRTVKQGVIVMTTPCGVCKGFGKKPKSVCKTCFGNREVISKRDININVLSGTKEGSSIKIDDNLRVIIRYKPHSEFQVVNNSKGEIGSNIIIDALDAITGCSKSINTLAGIKKIKVPAGTQPGSLLRLRGCGLSQGNHIVGINIKIPKLNEEQIKKINEVKNGTDDNGKDLETDE